MAWDSTKPQRSRRGDWVSRDFVQSLECSITSFFSETPESAAPAELSRDELRHYLSDLIYEVSDRESLKEIANLANEVITRRRKARKR